MENGIFVTLAVIAVIFVNGATDAPNSVAGAVSSGVLKLKNACAVCAVFNFAGVVLSGMFFPYVTETVSDLTLRGDIGVAAALISVVLFSSAAWLFGIPTSESHGLIASLGGVSLYYTGSAGEAFLDVTLKSVASCAVGFLCGAVMLRVIRPVFRKWRITSEQKWGSILSVFCAASMSFCHGMQDGQKFIAVLSGGDGSSIPFSVCLICAFVMAAGCFSCGKRIINKLGSELAGNFEVCESTASDTSSLICTVLSSLFGIPVSTTYMKTCSMLGAAVSSGKRADLRCVTQLVLTWIFTYPLCMVTAYLICAVMEMIV